MTGCSTGTAGSLQESLPLPPIYYAVRSNYSEPSGGPPHAPLTEGAPQLPSPCNPGDPKQDSLPFAWNATYTFYTIAC